MSNSKSSIVNYIACLFPLIPSITPTHRCTQTHEPSHSSTRFHAHIMYIYILCMQYTCGLLGMSENYEERKEIEKEKIILVHCHNKRKKIQSLYHKRRSNKSPSNHQSVICSVSGCCCSHYSTLLVVILCLFTLKHP